jgi:bifunctional DNase/RNase
LKTTEFLKGKERLKPFVGAIGILFVSLFFFSGEILAKKVPSNAWEQKDLLQVKVHQLGIDPTSMQPVVFLTDSREERALPIWIGPFEANAMQAAIQGTKSPRPLTHDLLENMIRKTNGKVQRIIVTHSKDGIYYATLGLEKDGKEVEMDARPSDAIVMALKFNAPIYVSKKLFREMAIPLGEQKPIEERYGLSIQELTPLLAESFSYKSTKGILVTEVRPGSLAEKDGLQRGDIFAEMGRESIMDILSFKAAMAKSKESVSAKIFRQGHFLSLTLHWK